MYYKERFYRNWVKADGLVTFCVKNKETDLYILADKDLSKEASQAIIKYRSQIQCYISKNPDFKTSLIALEEDITAPDIVNDMIQAAQLAKVGPMSAVAGAINDYIAKDLLNWTKEIIIENGGDLFIKSQVERKIGIFVGSSKWAEALNIKIKPSMTPMGICTSSGTVSHSLSFGKAEAVCVLTKTSCLADASATSIANFVKQKSDIKMAINFGKKIKGISGILIIIGNKFGVWGNIEIC